MAAENGDAKKTTTAPPPCRPTIALPPRPGFGFPGDASPGPMTLVSSFFAEDPESECRSFSQLLAGAMASPVAAPAPPPAPSGAGRRAADGEGGGGGRAAASASEEGRGRERGRGSESSGLRQSQPVGVLMVPSPYFTVPVGLSPGSLLESPALFQSSSGQFGMSHQQALAQVTAQAAMSHSHMHVQSEYPSSVSSAAATTTSNTQPASNSAMFQQMVTQTSESKPTSSDLADVSHADQRSQSTSFTVDKPADDGYNWRKYGQKQVKGSEYPRSYYKCTHPSCPVKKKVERSLNGHITEIIYKGQHNHQRPLPGRRAREGILPNESNGNLDPIETSSHGQSGNFIRSNETNKRDQESGQATTEQLSGSSDGEEVGDAEVGTDERDGDEPEAKRRNMDFRAIQSGASHKTVTEPRIIVQTTSEVDLLDDGYRWRKYGQKIVKGNPHPRSYYKCTYTGCSVRKHVERASTDPKAVITTYEGKHNHDVPAARNSSHNTANAGSAVNVIQPKVINVANNQALRRMEFRNNDQQHAGILQLKEEHDIT